MELDNVDRWTRMLGMRRAGKGDQGAEERGRVLPTEGLIPVTGLAGCGRVMYIVEW